MFKDRGGGGRRGTGGEGGAGGIAQNDNTSMRNLHFQTLIKQSAHD